MGRGGGGEYLNQRGFSDGGVVPPLGVPKGNHGLKGGGKGLRGR